VLPRAHVPVLPHLAVGRPGAATTAAAEHADEEEQYGDDAEDPVVLYAPPTAGSPSATRLPYVVSGDALWGGLLDGNAAGGWSLLHPQPAPQPFDEDDHLCRARYAAAPVIAVAAASYPSRAAPLWATPHAATNADGDAAALFAPMTWPGDSLAVE
jgi:hypothetical protein